MRNNEDFKLETEKNGRIQLYQGCKFGAQMQVKMKGEGKVKEVFAFHLAHEVSDGTLC